MKDRDGKEVKLVKVRNPWGKGEWKHDWNDNDSRWNPQLKAEVGLENADDGIFFMPWEQFLLSVGHICCMMSRGSRRRSRRRRSREARSRGGEEG